jgi:hypothetical protein
LDANALLGKAEHQAERFFKDGLWVSVACAEGNVPLDASLTAATLSIETERKVINEKNSDAGSPSGRIERMHAPGRC